jgi:hypothetical protein
MTRMAAARDHKKEAAWRRHISGQAGSGLSIGGYCRKHGLQASGFYWWRRELARRDAEPPSPPAPFVPVTVAVQTPASTGEGRIEIILPGDRRVRVVGPVDRQRLADVLAVLEDREVRREEERC